MTREEAITVLKGLYNNPLFNDVHKVAFNIAIHDIKAYHKWNLNELVLTQKDNEQEPILDKLKAEIIHETESIWNPEIIVGMKRVVDIIDKYKAESEDKE